MMKYFLFLFLFTFCSNVENKTINNNDNNNKKVKNTKHKFLKTSTKNEEIEKDFTYLLYRYSFDNLTEQQKEEKYSKIEEGFFESIFLEKNEENENDNRTDNDLDEFNENLKKKQDGDDKITYKNNNYNSKVKIPMYKINIVKLREKLKIKERDTNICHINKNITITPSMTLITNKKRKANLKLTIKF